MNTKWIKRCVALLLLVLMIFNLVGYRFVEMYSVAAYQQRIQDAFEQGLFHNKQFIEIEVPIDLPYYYDKPYERYEGNVEVQGVTYSCVEIKITHGRLVMKCLPNDANLVEKKALDAFWALSDLNHQSTGVYKVDKKDIPLNICQHFTPVFNPPVLTQQQVVVSYKNDNYRSPFLHQQKHPPQV